jgi:adenosylhomocysteine nucleosidase/adenosylhomocysteine/aminodeoxyfutalosine nucleosidase
MIGISIAANREWRWVLEKFELTSSDCESYPFGEYFKKNLFGEELIIYKCGHKKVCSSAATQYMIDHFNLPKIIVVGTCAGIDETYNTLDIIFPERLVQCDCNLPEFDTLIHEAFSVYIDMSRYSTVKTGTLGTEDKPVVFMEDLRNLQENGITVADMEAAAIAYVCKVNNVECVVIKGISDFPKEVHGVEDRELVVEQHDVFVVNIPIIMNNIFDNYLEFALKNHFDYVENKSFEEKLIF